jgi:indolepyruvate ferredoxin oxidoreductase alpha subunit
MLEPADSAECLEFSKYAYELSEKYDTPVMLRLCTRVSHSQSIVETSERVEPPVKPYVKNHMKYVMVPAAAKLRHTIIEQRTLDLEELAETSSLNRIEMGDAEIGVITSGTAYQYVKEVFGDSVSVLKLGIINPLPSKLIRDFASKVKRLAVIEELDPVIENHCRKLGLNLTGKDVFPLLDEFSQNLIAQKLGEQVNQSRELADVIPPRPPVMCAGCPHRGLFYVLSKLKLTVLGDIGCYSLGASPPLSAMDTTICMGASISGLHGFVRAGGKNSVAVIGDSTFAHTGINGLVDIAYNGSDSTVLILDNSTTGMTGHQENPTTGFNIRGEPAAGKIDLEALCRAMGINRVHVVDPFDLAECEKAIMEETALPGPSVIIARRPCVLLKSVKPGAPLAVDADKCTGCKACMKIGCPAISSLDKKVSVNATQCTGCGVCKQLCKFGALAETGKEG